MPEPLSIEAARAAHGLRLMTVPGVPTPWSEAAKGFLYIKKLAYTPFVQSNDDEPDVLRKWSGQTSKPVLAWNDEPPATGWSEILFLAERLEPEPRLIPADRDERVEMFGYAHELAGEMGFGWCFRLLMFAEALSDRSRIPLAPAIARALGPKYHYSEGMTAVAPRRMIEILESLDGALARQQHAGRRYLVGETLSAADVYWACFCALLQPLPEALCPTQPMIRDSYCLSDEAINAALSQRLLDHRQYVYETHLELPVRW